MRIMKEKLSKKEKPKFKEKMRNLRLGKHLSAETKAKMSLFYANKRLEKQKEILFQKVV